MYIFISIFIYFVFLLGICFQIQKRNMIHQLAAMSAAAKLELLNSLVQPLGFRYDNHNDIFSSLLDAPQRAFGYTSLYDQGAAFFHMVFDCQTIYFDYDGKTWLIEFWKGQYGISTGAEIGIYHADRIVPPKERKKALFHSVRNQHLLPLSIQLFRHKKPLYYIDGSHWWLTGFCMGLFSKPEDLHLKLTITFPTHEMLSAFIDALLQIGYSPAEFYTTEFTVYLNYRRAHHRCPCRRHPILLRLSQFRNRIYSWLYLKLTNPCQTTVDRLLFLYFALPQVFRRFCRIRTPEERRRPL